MTATIKQVDLIRNLSESYLYHKRQLREDELGIRSRPYCALEGARMIVSRTEYACACLNESDRFIIQNEVILGKRGDWYQGLLSSATYYRHRKTAYSNFIRRLSE